MESHTLSTHTLFRVCSLLICLVLMVSAVSAVTTEVHVVKIAADGSTVLAERTVDYQWLESNLPVLGDGVTHYYLQGPVFDGDVWDPTESVNVEEKDMGALKGTDLRDICDLVGGMQSDDTLVVRASDGFSKRFSYNTVYSPPAREGPIVLTWYRGDEGYVPSYSNGMRIVFFADTTVNPWGYHVFGLSDMKASMPSNDWNFFDIYPTTTGLSVMYVNEIQIISTQQAPTTTETTTSATPTPTPTPTATPTEQPTVVVTTINTTPTSTNTATPSVTQTQTPTATATTHTIIPTVSVTGTTRGTTVPTSVPTTAVETTVQVSLTATPTQSVTTVTTIGVQATPTSIPVTVSTSPRVTTPGTTVPATLTTIQSILQPAGSSAEVPVSTGDSSSGSSSDDYTGVGGTTTPTATTAVTTVTTTQTPAGDATPTPTLANTSTPVMTTPTPPFLDTGDQNEYSPLTIAGGSNSKSMSSSGGQTSTRNFLSTIQSTINRLSSSDLSILLLIAAALLFILLIFAGLIIMVLLLLLALAGILYLRQRREKELKDEQSRE